MSEVQTYNQLDIQRYLQHKMSSQEMHAFEKALMNDPFLADALEGFSASDPDLTKEHLNTIERLLTNDEQDVKVVQLPLKKTVWLRVAAIILVIISVAAITYSVVNNYHTNDQVAVTASKKNISERDSIGPVEKPLAQAEVLPLNPSTPNQGNTSPLIRSGKREALAYQKQSNKNAEVLFDLTNRNTLSKASSEPAIAMQSNPAPAAPSMRLPDAEVMVGYGTVKRMDTARFAIAGKTVAENEFKGKVVDNSGETVPFASVEALSTRKKTVSDAKGNFSLKATDSILDIKVNSPGYATAQTKIKSNKAENRVALKEDELSLAEIVVTSLHKSKRNNMGAIPLDSTISAEPVGGWKSFNQYLKQKLDSLKATEANDSFSEDIVLEFSIDKQGKPTNIKAPANVDKTTAGKAIEILSNGPKWKNRKKDKKVKVIIPF